MTSISSIGLQAFHSPRELLQTELTAEISAGAIDSADEEALSSALDDIDASLQADRGSGIGNRPPSPAEMKQKITDLIASQVESGKLTDSQARELTEVFDNAFEKGAPGGPGGPGGPGRSGGPGASSGGPGGALMAAGSDDTASSSDTNDLLQDFLKLLQEARDTSGYNATGDVQSILQSLLVDYQT